MSSHPSVLAWLSAVAFIGCTGTDPILEKAAAGASDAQPAAGGAAATTASDPPRKGQPAEPQPGRAGDPAPGKAGEPVPGKAGEPAAAKPAQPKPVQEGPPPPGQGPGVKLAGKVVLPDHKGGAIKVDVFDGDQKAASGGGKRPGVVAMARLDAPGSFEVVVPEGVERVWLGAFADEDKDGKPGPLDPECWYDGNPVDMSKPQDDLELVLIRRAPPPGQ